jgi:trans-aconitate methyltransferase
MAYAVVKRVKMLHEKSAEFYRYRMPYLADLFPDLIKALHLNHDSVIADIGAGQGEISRKLNNHVKKIYAVDAAENMMRKLADIKNVIPMKCDVNKQDLIFTEKIDAVFFGRSIHWVDVSSLKTLLEKNLRGNGAVAVLTSGFSNKNRWISDYMTLRKKHSYPLSSTIDIHGGKTLQSIGFVQSNVLSLNATVEFNADMLMLNMLSYEQCASRVFGERMATFKHEVQEFSSSIAVANKISAQIVTVARVFTRLMAS